MRIALLGAQPVPLTYGGTDRLWEGLRAALDAHHPTELVTLPVDERSEEGVLRGYHDFYHLDLSRFDCVISTKAPTYMARHPVHVAYLQHRMRVFYDLYEPRGEHFARLRRMIHWMDRWALSPDRIAHLFTIGQTVSNRLMRWGGLKSTVIRHPSTYEPLEPGRGEHLLAVGRLHEWKRFDLIIKAFRQTKIDLPLVIAGTGPEEERLREMAEGDDRIRFTGYIIEQRLRELYANALATIFPPIHEDLGMVTLESMASGKPVLTTSDSGEPALMVEPGRTGWVCAPKPEVLAEQIQWIGTHRDEVEAMTPSCREAVLDVTWERVAGALIEAAQKRMETLARQTFAASGIPPAREGGQRRIRLVVTDNQIIDPPVGGGRIRIWELYRHLPEEFTTVYVGTHDHPGPVGRDQWLAPNFREVIMPLTSVHFRAHGLWHRATRGDATIDVTIPLLLGRCSPRYHRLIGEFAPQADVLVTAHPWMSPFVPRLPGVPRVYDSQNCEVAVKAPLLGRTLAGRYLSRRVAAVERHALAHADLTLACSPADAEQFERRYGTPRERIVLVPNGVDCERIRPGGPADGCELRRRLGLGGEPLAIFVGSDYEPNLESVDFIVDGLAPACPGVQFVIVGGVGDGWRARRARQLPDNVHMTGLADDELLLLCYRGADFAINPMRLGSGTNIKMLDYLASGLPIATTAEGARGLSGTPGRHWLQEPRASLAEAVRRLADQPELRRTLAAEARALAESSYDWRAISSQYAEALHTLLERFRSGGTTNGKAMT